MRNTLLFTLALIGIATCVQAQEIAKNALGLRFGGSNGVTTEINYQLGLSGNNRIEFGLGWNDGHDYSAYKMTALYEWVFKLDGNFNWYAGAGGGLGQAVSDNDHHHGDMNNETFVFAAGDIGVEYDFDIPLLISLDFRPELSFGDFIDNLNFNIALALRYQF